MSAQSRQELARFIGTSVLPNTNRAYDKFWMKWISFLKSEVDEDDPFVSCAEEEEKAALVGLMMMRKHEQGLRGKQATSFTAAIRLRRPTRTLDRFSQLASDRYGKGCVQNEARGAP